MAQYNGRTLEAEREKQKALKKDAQLQAALLDLPPSNVRPHEAMQPG